MVSKVTEGGVADQCGVWEGDEVTRVNGRAVRDAGWVGTISSLDGKKNSLSLSLSLSSVYGSYCDSYPSIPQLPVFLLH